MTRAEAGRAPDSTPGPIRRSLEDMGVFVTGAAILLVLGSLFLVAAAQSPTMLQWTGTPVKAVEDGGIAYYTFRGQSYTLDMTSPLQQSSTVYVDPAEPSNAIFSNPVTRWGDISTVGGPYSAAVLVLALGFARRSRRRRRRERDLGSSSSSWLDRPTMSRLLEHQRRTDS